jgi:hypothetical protein
MSDAIDEIESSRLFSVMLLAAAETIDAGYNGIGNG